jgi:hypothetical protein
LNIKKEYYAERRDEIMERNKKRHEENKERYYQNIKTRQENNHIKFHCECGSVVCFMDRHGHLKTKKHKTYMEEKINYK